MAGQRIGYERVSALDQNEKRPLDGQILVGSSSRRPGGIPPDRNWRSCCALPVTGTVVVHSMDRLARNLEDLRAWSRASPAKACALSSSRNTCPTPERASGLCAAGGQRSPQSRPRQRVRHQHRARLTESLLLAFWPGDDGRGQRALGVAPGEASIPAG